jgi:hypothetical protein
MNIYAAAFLLPVGVMAYTAQGGLKASYVASWANTGVFNCTMQVLDLCLVTEYVREDSRLLMVHHGPKRVGRQPTQPLSDNLLVCNAEAKMHRTCNSNEPQERLAA